MKTYENCKDEIAQNNGFDSWAEMDKAMEKEVNLFHPLNNPESWNCLFNQAARLYAESVAKTALVSAAENLVEWGHEKHPDFKSAKHAIIHLTPIYLP